ncbi:MAG: glycerophosphodiester phosphodiesterase [Oscillospiraceae bacterium]|jgi:glycerophosphoryl diester phosphodiesterase|nr:glycerophosphodiester phosphodiesterase [Oscillospiraceae bacterium]
MPAQIWAHRGDSFNAPENTLPAFQQAIDAGADGIELDVQRTSDGVVVVAHDDTINRVSNGVGEVAKLPLAELRKYDFSKVKDGFKGAVIPTLEETLRMVEPSSLQLNVELKRGRQADEGLAPAALTLVRSFGMMSRVVFSSFDLPMLEQTRLLEPDARLGILFDLRQRAPWDFAKTIRAEAMHGPIARARLADFIARCHDSKLLVRLWTVDAPSAIERTIRGGVDGVITNRPSLALKIRDALTNIV